MSKQNPKALRKQRTITRVTSLSVNPTSAHFYSEILEGFQSSARHRANQFNLDDNDHAGKVSDKGRKRLECAISWLLYGAKAKKVVDQNTGKKFVFKINFITLTLCAKQAHPDAEITNTCLGNWLDVARKQFKVQNYIWRAEAQGNGNIHFHIVTDCYIHYNDIRRTWNKSIELLGYVSRYKSIWHHDNPNSTDVHSVKHVTRLSSYLSKYMSKERAFTCVGELRRINGVVVEILYGSDQYRQEAANQKKGKVIGHVLGARIRPITSRLWFCSRSLSSQKNIIIHGEQYEFTAAAEMIKATEHRAYQGEFVRSLYGDFSEVCRSHLNQTFVKPREVVVLGGRYVKDDFCPF